MEEGGPLWTAYELMVNKVESTYGVTLGTIHRRLNEQKMQGRPFTEILGRVMQLYGIAAFDASVVVRSYPGYETQEDQAMGLRRFLSKWMRRPRRPFSPQPGLAVNPAFEPQS